MISGTSVIVSIGFYPIPPSSSFNCHLLLDTPLGVPPLTWGHMPALSPVAWTTLVITLTSLPPIPQPPTKYAASAPPTLSPTVTYPI